MRLIHIFLLQMTLLTRQLLLAMLDRTTNIIMIAAPQRATADQQIEV